ncbi:ArsR/SmtB family transcription factor [Paenibacillus kyungheensis]
METKMENNNCIETKTSLDTRTKFIRGFSDKTRLQILDCLLEEEKTVSQIVNAIKGNQSNISQHLSCLKGCGIITGRQEGKYVYYQLANQKIKLLLTMFDEALEEVESKVACCEQNETLLPTQGGVEHGA